MTVVSRLLAIASNLERGFVTPARGAHEIRHVVADLDARAIRPAPEPDGRALPAGAHPHGTKDYPWCPVCFPSVAANDGE